MANLSSLMLLVLGMNHSGVCAHCDHSREHCWSILLCPPVVYMQQFTRDMSVHLVFFKACTLEQNSHYPRMTS